MVLTVLSLVACEHNERVHSETKESKNIGNERIKTKSIKHGNHFKVSIIEVDGVEYLVNYQGGIYPLIKKEEK